jgi:hypothetical protein
MTKRSLCRRAALLAPRTASSVALVANCYGAPCVLASERPSHPGDERRFAKASWAKAFRRADVKWVLRSIREKESAVSRRDDSGRPGTISAITGAAVALAALAFAVGCTGDEPAGSEEPAQPVSTAAPDTGPPAPPPADELPDPVEQTRAAIFSAASAQDYDALEAVIDPEVFLSDAGFGVDPVPYWRDRGTEPLEAMEVLLALPHTVSETNEGTLYQWPRFTADSDPEEMSEAEREALTALLGEERLEASFLDETGYVAPRLGILADGTWWFLVLEPAP